MADEYDEAEQTTTTPFRVFISRLPTSWTAGLIVEHFNSLGFGEVAGAEIFTTKKKKALGRGAGNVCYAFKNDGKCERGANCPFSHGSEGSDGPTEESLGAGVVYFTSEEGVAQALAQRSLYVSHRTIRISAFESVDDGRDVTACYAWAKGQCTHGDACKFSHEGPGGCMAVGERYAGRKFQCMSFKAKGKCSKGEACAFLHVLREKKGEKKGETKAEPPATGKRGRATESAGEEEDDGEEAGEGGDEKEGGKVADKGAGKGAKEAGKRGLCHAFQKEGGCKKGDRCIFEHVEKATLAGAGGGGGGGPDRGSDAKRRKIDGRVLVERRKENKVTKFDE